MTINPKIPEILFRSQLPDLSDIPSIDGLGRLFRRNELCAVLRASENRIAVALRRGELPQGLSFSPQRCVWPEAYLVKFLADLARRQGLDFDGIAPLVKDKDPAP